MSDDSPFKRRDRWVLLGLLLVGLVAYFGVRNDAGHRGGVAELDGYYYYIYLRSMQMDGDIRLANDYRRWGNPFKFGTTTTGRARNIFGVGPALLWSPFFAVTHAAAWVGTKLGVPLSLDGMSRFHQLGTFLGTLLYGWLAVLLCTRIAARLVGPRHAVWGALGAALAGPLPYYCLTWASYSHAQAAMAASLVVWLWVSWRQRWTTRRWLLWGAASGLLLLVRPASAPFLLIPALEGLRYLLRAPAGERLRHSAQLALAAAAALVVFSPQLVAWKLLFGQFLVTPQGEGFMRWGASAWAATLFSPRNGLFTSAPLMLVALVALGLRCRREPATTLPLAAVFVALVLVNGAVYDWWGWGFSARRFTCALPLFAVGLTAALGRSQAWLEGRPRRAIAWGTGLVVLAAVLFNLQWMRLFTRQNLRWTSVHSTEGLYMTVLHSMLKDVYSEVGNPLSLPGSLAFKIRHGAPLRVYDRIHGTALLGEAHPGANPSEDPLRHATLDLGSLESRPYLSSAFGNPQRRDGVGFSPLREPVGQIYLPVNRPGRLRILLHARASSPGMQVTARLNGELLGQFALHTDAWSRTILTVPGAMVRRGINRLDLEHRSPQRTDKPGALRCSSSTPPICVRADLAAVSGGIHSGRFAEIWRNGRRVSDGSRGINVAVLAAQDGRLLGARGFDVVLYPAMYQELGRYLDRFPKGSVVALAARDRAGRRFTAGSGAAVLARIGAVTDLRPVETAGYVALGTLGADPGTALERVAPAGHARLALGRVPPPWREVALYRTVALR